jgi:hypothetical protein
MAEDMVRKADFLTILAGTCITNPFFYADGPARSCGYLFDCGLGFQQAQLAGDMSGGIVF